MDEKKGVWRTIRGRRVFIEEGQSLYDAMEKSGKFSKLQGSNRPRVHAKTQDKENRKRFSDVLDEIGSQYKIADDEIAEARRLGSDVKEEIAKDKRDYALGKLKQQKENIIKSQRNLEKYMKNNNQRKEYELKMDKYDEDMLRSIYAYSNEEPKEKTNYYKKIEEKYGKDFAEKKYKELEDKYDIEVGTFTDSDGVSYNRLKEKDWRKQVKSNYAEMEKKLQELESKRGKGEYQYNDDRWLDDYYGTFRENEKRNAKIKKENPDEKYEYVEAYAGYKEKFNKHGDYDTWYGSEYTNDEFMEHLTDANWHAERKLIEEAGLTNAQLTKLKNQVKLAQWSADLDMEKTRRLIDEVKGSNKSKGDKVREIKAQNSKVNEITKEEYDKMPKDYKGTLKELVDTAEFRGENKEELKKKYEDMGYDVENDKTILKLTNGGTTLQPVKVKAYSKTEQDILDYFTEDFGWQGTTPEKAFVKQIDDMRYSNESDYEVGKRYAQGGSMLVYNQDMADYLNSRGVKATEEDAFEKYTDYIGRNIAKLYRELKKK